MVEKAPQQTVQENSSEQKHMFSAWEKCVEEAKGVSDLKFLETEKGKVLLAPNGKESEYNKYRPQDEQGNYLDNKTIESIDNPVNLLARVVRTKTFIEGDKKLDWIGIKGNYAVYESTQEPLFAIHGTNAIFKDRIYPIKRESRWPHMEEVSYFAPEYLYSYPNYSKTIYVCFVSIRKPNIVNSHDELMKESKFPNWKTNYDGVIQLNEDLETEKYSHSSGEKGKQLAVFNTNQIFHIPFSLFSNKPKIKPFPQYEPLKK